MSYLQLITYKSGDKEYTEEIIADTPEKAESAINSRLGTTISVQKVLTSVPSTVFTNVLK